MPTWLIVVQVVAIAATFLIAGVVYLRSGKSVVPVAAQPLADDNAKTLAEVGKALDLYRDLMAAGKSHEDALAALSPVVQTLAFPAKPAAPGAAK